MERGVSGGLVRPAVDNRCGGLWHILAGFLFSLMAVLAKLLGDRLPSAEIAFARTFLGFLLLTPLLHRAGRSAWRTERLWLHVTRGTVGTLALLCSFYAITNMPLAEATSLSFTKPLFQVLLAALILRETVRAPRWGATILGFVGVLVMLRPSAGTIQLAGLVALLGAACVAVVGIALRELAQGERHLTILAYLGLIGTIVTGIPAAFVFVVPTTLELGVMVAMAVIGIAGQACLIRGYAVGEASALAVYDYARLPFAALFGYLLFAERPDLAALLGALLIALSTLYIARYDTRHAVAAGDRR